MRLPTRGDVWRTLASLTGDLADTATRIPLVGHHVAITLHEAHIACQRRWIRRIVYLISREHYEEASR